jgi:IclR family pca regulon transcriptional regulator
VVAAMNISVHASRNSVESMRTDLLPRLLVAAEKINADLQVIAPRRTSRPAGA